MYKISVPIVIPGPQLDDSREETLKGLNALGVKRVYLSPGRYITDESQLEKTLDILKSETEYFKSLGFEVGSWMWTLWADNPLPFTEITALSGKKLPQFYCMLDPDFRAYVAEYVKKLAKCGVDMIMFDDDMRYGNHGNGVNCFCPHHIKEMSRLAGKDINLETLKNELFTGAPNEYRALWLESKANALRAFAKDVRDAINEVDPTIRAGFCSCITNWSAEGCSPIEIEKIFAGDTKPFLRTIGAPYWAVKESWGNKLQNIIELNRMEIEACKDTGLEVFTEGDVFPRPRHRCPAAYLEMYDIAMRANGGTDGILKYALLYNSTAKYDNGYIKRHLRNIPLYEKVEQVFSDKECIGVRIYNNFEKLLDKTFYKDEDPEHIVDNCLYNPAMRITSDGAIPTVYSGDGIGGIAFGEDVLSTPADARRRGLVIDLTAAEILMKQDVDVGIESIGERMEYPAKEYFIKQKEYDLAHFKPYEVKLRPSAEVDSEAIYLDSNKNETRYPIAYYYENAEGERFFVFTLRMYYQKPDAYRSYARALQIRDAIERISGKKLPAFIAGNPDVYLITKRGEDGSLAIGVFNLSVDSLIDAAVELDKEYTALECINCTGSLDGDKVLLGDIPPFAFAALTLK